MSACGFPWGSAEMLLQKSQTERGLGRGLASQALESGRWRGLGGGVSYLLCARSL